MNIRPLIVIILAMVSVAVMELYALHQGIDGKCLTISVGVMAGLGGYHLPKITASIKGPPKPEA